MQYKIFSLIGAFFCLSICYGQNSKNSIEDGINNKFFLRNETSFKSIFKGKTIKWYEDYEKGKLTYLFSSKKTQVLELIHSPGEGKYDFAEFNLYSPDIKFTKQGIALKSVDTFYTNKGFYLGEVYNANNKIFKGYKKKVFNKQSFMLYKEVDLGWIYFQKLYFKNNKIYRIYFGYNTP